MAMAMSEPVTVSIGELTTGVWSVMRRVSRDWSETEAALKSM